MKKHVIGGVLFCVFSFLTIQNAYADDHQPPFKGGNYWEVTGIKTEDGAGLKYSKWLAAEWRKSMEFAVSKGWLESYTVLYNVHARADEPDIYIVRQFKDWASEDENDKRRGEYMEWAKKSMEKMENESGDRAEYRTIMSTVLLQEMLPRNE